MAIVRWEPGFRGMLDLRNEMDRIFDNVLSNRFKPVEEAAIVPSIDVSETPTEVKVKATIPGVDRKDLTVTIQDNIVTIKGEHREEKEEKDKNYYRKEIAYGSFSRSVALPAEVKGDAAKATLKDGVLELAIPKAEKAKANVVDVEVK